MNALSAWPREDVRRVVNSALKSNTYLLKAAEGGRCVVIDPGLDRDAIELEIATSGWTPEAVLCTHGHFDHVGSAAWVQQTFGVPVILRKADHKLAKMSNFMMAAFRLPQRIALPDFQLLDDDASSVEFGGRRYVFHPLPGHTPGSAGITTDDMLFSGDSLYASKTALSKLPGEDHDQLRSSLTGLFSWIGADVRVLPGHGGSATIAEIHEHNHELRSFMATGTTA